MSMDEALSEYFEGIRLLENNSLREALEHFLYSLELDEHFKTCHQIYKVYDKLGDQESAYTYIIRAYKLNPNNDLVAFELAKKKVEKDLIDEAKFILSGILKRNPTYGPAKKMLNSI